MHRLLKHPSLLAVSLFLAGPAEAWAGMPVVTLTDVARLRLQNLSFFLAGLLVSAALIQFLWNRLRRDFTGLPRLTYGKAVTAVVLWGLLFVLVLTMISGARELLTPGAWERQGFTYRLAEPKAEPAAEEAIDASREQKLHALRLALWTYALSHDGRFPRDRTDAGIPAEAWRLPDPSGMRYLYVAGKKGDEGATPLAYEPEVFGRARLVLLTNGVVRRLREEDLGEVPAGAKP